MKIDLRKALATLTRRESEAAGRGGNLSKDDSTLQKFLERRISWYERRSGADKTNAPYKPARQLCIDTARAIWDADTDREFGKADMIGLCRAELEREDLKQPKDETLWSWLKDAGIVPDYASAPGRRPNEK